MSKSTKPIGDIKILEIKTTSTGIIITAIIELSDNKK